MFSVQPYFQSNFGFFIKITSPSSYEFILISIIIIISLIMGLIPTYFAYKKTLIDGIAVKL